MCIQVVQDKLLLNYSLDELDQFFEAMHCEVTWEEKGELGIKLVANTNDNIVFDAAHDLEDLPHGCILAETPLHLPQVHTQGILQAGMLLDAINGMCAEELSLREVTAMLESASWPLTLQFCVTVKKHDLGPNEQALEASLHKAARVDAIAAAEQEGAATMTAVEKPPAMQDTKNNSKPSDMDTLGQEAEAGPSLGPPEPFVREPSEASMVDEGGVINPHWRRPLLLEEQAMIQQVRIEKESMTVSELGPGPSKVLRTKALELMEVITRRDYGCFVIPV